MGFTDSLIQFFQRKKSKHQTRTNGSYYIGSHNRPGTKLVRKWYGEDAAAKFNR